MPPPPAPSKAGAAALPDRTRPSVRSAKSSGSRPISAGISSSARLPFSEGVTSVDSVSSLFSSRPPMSGRVKLWSAVETWTVSPAPTSMLSPPSSAITSTRPSATCTAWLPTPAVTVKVVPFTTAAITGVSTRKCWFWRLSTLNIIVPTSCRMRVMPFSSATGSDIRLFGPTTMVCGPRTRTARPSRPVESTAPPRRVSPVETSCTPVIDCAMRTEPDNSATRHSPPSAYAVAKRNINAPARLAKRLISDITHLTPTRRRHKPPLPRSSIGVRHFKFLKNSFP